MRRVGIRAHLQPAKSIRPLHQLVKIRTERRLNRRYFTEEHAAGRAVYSNPFALGYDFSVHGELLLTVINLQGGSSADAGFAHAARDHRSVTGHAAARSYDRLRRDHPVKIIRAGLLPDQYHLSAFLRHLFSLIRTKDDLALRGAGAGGQTSSEDLRVSLGIDSRMQ